MGLTVRDVMERTRSGYLQAGNVNPDLWDTIDTAMNASDLAMSLSGRLDVPDDSVLEAKDGTMELVLNKATSETNDLTLQERGFLETTPAAHDADTRWDLDPVWPDISVFNALESTISSLYGYGLYARVESTDLTYSSSTFVTLPASAKDVVGDVYVASGTTYNIINKGTGYQVLKNFSPPRVQFFRGGYTGAPLTLVYKSDFLLPTDVFDEDDHDTLLDVDLDDCLIPTSLQSNLPMAVAAYILQGRDVPVLDNQRVREALANAGISPGTRSGLAEALLSKFVRGPVHAERKKLLDAAPVSTTYAPL